MSDNQHNNESLNDKDAANIKAECGESCCCDSKSLHVHNVKLERREGNKEERDSRDIFSFPYKIRLEL